MYVNRRPNKVWLNVSIRRFISLFIPIIWLAAALQPCVMASVKDDSFQGAETHLSSTTSSDHSTQRHSRCPHCKTATGDTDCCVPASADDCDGNSTFVYYERVKPVNTDKFYAQFKTQMPISGLQHDTRTYSTPVAALSKSLYLPAGPPLIDLYRVYLK
jgi:hypothetical protein